MRTCTARHWVARPAAKLPRLAMWVVVGLSLGGARLLSAEPAAGDAPKSWAVLIGVEKYHRVPPLEYTVDDVEQLANTLRNRGGYPAECILAMTDRAANARQQPLKASIEAEMPAFLKKAGAKDTLIIFFSGHGFRDVQGKLYLAPLDCDVERLATTALPMQWVKEQLAACAAEFKLLVIDSCHAGAEKGEADTPGVSAGELGEPLKGLAGVVTLASCLAKEKSQIWKERRQSLFSYWLNQGLRGHADVNGDGAVDIDELYNYVHRRVTTSAKAGFPLPQTPVRSVLTGRPGVPTIVTLKPQDLRQAIADMAEMTARLLEERQLAKVGVLEFSNQNARLDEALGADFGLLGRLGAEWLEQQLVEQSGGKFRVVNRRQLQTALSGEGFTLGDLGSSQRLQRLSSRSGGMPAIALGVFSNRAHRIVTMRCKLIETASGDEVGMVGATAALSESQWAMLGRSAATQPTDFRPEPGPPGKPAVIPVVQRLDERSAGPHPLTDRGFPYRVSIVVGGKKREPVFVGNDCYVALKKGEVYEIHIDNASNKPTVMRLLVDGLNTLPEEEKSKGVRQWLVAPRVSLDVARPWLLDPKIAKTYAVRGFVTETGAEGRLRQFLVVDAQDSVAARQKFTDQLGLITAAFYAPASDSRGVGTGLGAEKSEDLRDRSDFDAGPLLAVVTIRYVEPDALAKLPRQ